MNTPVIGRIYIASHPRWRSVKGRLLPNYKLKLFEPLKSLTGKIYYNTGDEVGLVNSEWDWKPLNINLENK